MLNSKFINDHARKFAKRLQSDAGPETPAQVRMALNLVTQRTPTDAEIDRGLRLIQDLREDGLDETAALSGFCLVALNLNEFIFLD